MLIAAACCIGGALILWPAVQNAREAARRTQCYGDLFWIRTALYNYHDEFGSLPPAVVTDESGRPMHSWRVLLMNNGGHMDGYSRQPPLPEYRFDEPWNSPSNRKLESTCFRTFACSSDPDSGALKRTNFVAVVGADTLWPRTGTRDFGDLQEPHKHSKYKDKILLIELPDSHIHWIEPRDITFDEAIALFTAPNGLKATRHFRDALLWEPAEGLHFITYGGHWERMDSIRDATHFAELLKIKSDPDVEQ